MDFKIPNRLFIGLILVISTFFSYLLNLDNILLIIILLLVTYDFYKINTNLPILFFFLVLCLILVLFIPYQNFKYFFILNTLFAMCVFLNTDYKKIFFLVSLYIFCLILFYINNFERNIFYTIILVSFFNDTIAYIIGKNFKGPLIIPKISPKKTWSGTVVSLIVTSFFLYYLNYNIYFSIIIATSLFIGDIFFSYIKRNLKIKDFSLLFGDHGGVLDRLDSMFFAAIIFQIYLVF